MAGGQGSQKNKAHKPGRRAGKSAREKHRDKRDVVQRTSLKGGAAAQSRAERLNAARQARDHKRAALLGARRAGGPPRLVALLPLSSAVDARRLWDGLLAAARSGGGGAAAPGGGGDGMEAEACAPPPAPMVPTTVLLPGRGRRARVTLLPPPRDRGDPLAVVDVARAAEVVLLALPGGAGAAAVDADGAAALGVLRSMGLPPAVALVQAGAAAAGGAAGLKDRAAVRRRATEAVTAALSSEQRVMPADSAADFAALLRHLADAPAPLPVWRRGRPALAVDGAWFEPAPGGDAAAPGALLLRGFVRGAGLSAAQLMHVPLAGDFQIGAILGPAEPRAANEAAPPPGAMDVDDDAAGGPGAAAAPVLAAVEPARREPLVRENAADPLAGEQTWPTAEEEAAADAAAAAARRRLPRGTSEYQAAWIVDGGDYGSDFEEGSDGGASGGGGGANGAAAPAAPRIDEGGGGDLDLDLDDAATEAPMDEGGDEDPAALAAQHAALRAARAAAEADDAAFPDEVEVPPGVAARARFAKYRGLKSLRTSAWDVRESLPREYGRVFAFESFRRAARLAAAAQARAGGGAGGVPAGTYACVRLEGVPPAAAARVVARAAAAAAGGGAPPVAWGLLRHESRLSVLHFGVRKAGGYAAPLPAKEPLLLVTGVRSFRARPVFSTDEHGADKHKAERFLHAGRPSVASVYAPIQYPPAPLLAFKMPDAEGAGGEGEGAAPARRPALAMTGGLRGADPDRVALKKAVLAGFPTRVHKLKAVVRFMFHSPEDVRWFRPVELWTRSGRRGRIREPLGTHGAMKCVFDGPVGQQDAVCMSLWKRAFPKWPDGDDLAFAD